MQKVTLPNGDRMTVVEFLRWWRTARSRRSQPGKGSPSVSCVTADIFSDCFVGATPGTINAGSPGPLNGWTWSQPFGPKGGQVTFAPDIMSFDCTNGTTPGATKAHAPLAAMVSITIQSLFTTFPGPIVPGRRYEWYVTNTGVTQIVKVSLNEDGFCFIFVGDPNSGSSYSGTWTPSIGQHKVHATVDALGVPRLWIDDVEITLSFDGSGFSETAPNISDVVAAYMVYITDPSQGSLQNLHVASGNLPTSTEFCCL